MLQLTRKLSAFSLSEDYDEMDTITCKKPYSSLVPQKPLTAKSLNRKQRGEKALITI